MCWTTCCLQCNVTCYTYDRSILNLFNFYQLFKSCFSRYIQAFYLYLSRMFSPQEVVMFTIYIFLCCITYMLLSSLFIGYFYYSRILSPQEAIKVAFLFQLLLLNQPKHPSLPCPLSTSIRKRTQPPFYILVEPLDYPRLWKSHMQILLHKWHMCKEVLCSILLYDSTYSGIYLRFSGNLVSYQYSKTGSFLFFYELH